MPVTHTPLRYPGGKSQLAPFVIDLMRANDLFYGEYIEPFAGGAGIACRLLLEGYVSQVHINDLDRSIYAFWWAVLNENERFCEKIDTVTVSVAQWRRQRRLQKAAKIDLFALGFSTFFLNRVNRSGIIDGGVIGGINQTGEYPIDCRFNRAELIKKVARIGAHASQIRLTNLDGRAFLTNLNRRKLHKALVNIDPPYFVKGKELYQNWFDPADHLELAEAVAKTKAMWMVTYDDTPETRALYARQRCFTHELYYAAQVKRVGVELLVLDRRLKLPVIAAAA